MYRRTERLGFEDAFNELKEYSILHNKGEIPKVMGSYGLVGSMESSL